MSICDSYAHLHVRFIFMTHSTIRTPEHRYRELARQREEEVATLHTQLAVQKAGSNQAIKELEARLGDEAEASTSSAERKAKDQRREEEAAEASVPFGENVTYTPGSSSQGQSGQRVIKR